MVLEVEEKDNTFRVKWQVDFGDNVSQEYSIGWLPDTPSNRKAILVMLRSIGDSNDEPLFTFQDLSVLFDSNNRQASSQHMEDFRASGGDFLCFLTRKRKVDSVVVEAVTEELKIDPLANMKDLREKVNIRLGRKDLTSANLKVAIDQISYEQIKPSLERQIQKGQVQYKEQYLIEEMMKSKASAATIGERIGIQVPESGGMNLSDPTNIRKLVDPNTEVGEVSKSLKLVVLCMVLCYHGISLSTIGGWLRVHKTTILRWIVSLSLELFPIVYEWIKREVKGSVVYIDEKWLKIRGKWHYWFVALDSKTGLPLVGELLDTKTENACKWLGQKLLDMGKLPRVIITDGMAAYESITSVIKGAKHVLCHFHYQQTVTPWLKLRFKEDKEIAPRKKKMKKVLQAEDKRTVKRRIEKLKEENAKEGLGIGEWIEQTEGKLSKLLPSVGSDKIPRTTNAIERFFRAFNRFYKVRCGFFSVISAKRELILFLLVYLFVRQENGKAPIESIMPEVVDMPFYILINDPMRSILGVEDVKKNVKMADFELRKSVSA
ncbi:DDE-type integrase/transposase/recombinase [Candidatus Poribacteria bacterium]|nr:DDE-type integrase/transposase/recombinase [Candidatus Poribacteria bacterium]